MRACKAFFTPPFQNARLSRRVKELKEAGEAQLGRPGRTASAPPHQQPGKKELRS